MSSVWTNPSNIAEVRIRFSNFTKKTSNRAHTPVVWIRFEPYYRNVLTVTPRTHSSGMETFQPHEESWTHTAVIWISFSNIATRVLIHERTHRSKLRALSSPATQCYLGSHLIGMYTSGKVAWVRPYTRIYGWVQLSWRVVSRCEFVTPTYKWHSRGARPQ